MAIDDNMIDEEVCTSCGHADYHCPLSGCNHYENDEWCECEKEDVKENIDGDRR